MATQKKSAARKLLDKLSNEPLTFGSMLKNIRECDELSLADLAAKLKVSRQHLHAIETGRRAVSTERVACSRRGCHMLHRCIGCPSERGCESSSGVSVACLVQRILVTYQQDHAASKVVWAWVQPRLVRDGFFGSQKDKIGIV
jgi:DNA-binding XRE family transcriptional regulator